ncbi:hypothetical protein CUJ83_06845 [Methanocella sp. CWC-04]|uniref:Polymer-forming protein n=1 Tax=Methanooceanicella nereidis TaxID=2052831 RepID=A0AAP2RCE6_9EURY|nr:hypothetical protein [Methanocella sp. CWC-04]MCD1294714.1 hypothetical protein [Methanocella sp. CWC-04]
MAEGMDRASIRAHKDSNTLIVMKNSNYTRPITHRVNVITGMNSRCLEHMNIDGNLELGKSAQILGNVRANKVILGPGSLITGDLLVDGDLVALDRSRVLGKVLCNGSAFVRPGVKFGSIEAAGLIEVYGKNPSPNMKGKVVVNKQE